MNKNNYTIQVNKRELLNALKALKKISDKPSKVNVMRFTHIGIEFCATNGQEAVKVLINIDENNTFEKEYILSNFAINDFITFLEIKCANEHIFISVDEEIQKITLLQNKNFSIAIKYIVNNENAYLLKSLIYADLVNTDSVNKDKNVFISSASCEEVLNISSGFQNDNLALTFRYNEALQLEMADFSAVMRYSIKLSDGVKYLISNYLQKRNASFNNENTLFGLKLKAFKEIVSLISIFEESTQVGFCFNLDELKHPWIKFYLEGMEKANVVYSCSAIRAAYVTKLDTIFENDAFSHNLFALNMEDTEVLSSIAPMLNGQGSYLLMEFDIQQYWVTINKYCDYDSDTDFKIKKELTGLKFEFSTDFEAELKGIIFVKYITALNKYLKTLQKNKGIALDNVQFRFRTNGEKKSAILLYYIETENLQYCFTGGTIKNID